MWNFRAARRRLRTRARYWLARHPKVRIRVWNLRRALRAGDDPRADAPAQPARMTVRLPLPEPPAGRPGRRVDALEFVTPRNMFIVRSLSERGIGGYEAESLAAYLAMLDVAPGGDVLDIGANVGIYGLLASALSERRVLAFEPTPWIAAEAEGVARHNGLAMRVRAEALGATRTVATFFLSDRTDSSNSLAEGFRHSTKHIDVRVETLDHVVRRNRLRPAVLKVDTETTEPDVINGAARTIKQFRPWILCEVLAGRSEERLQQAFAPFGYRMYPVTDQVPYEEAKTVVGDPTYKNLMWLFAPEEPPAHFWESVTQWRRALDAVATGPAPKE